MGLLLLWNIGFYDQGVINFYNYWIMPIIYYRLSDEEISLLLGCSMIVQQHQTLLIMTSQDAAVCKF